MSTAFAASVRLAPSLSCAFTQIAHVSPQRSAPPTIARSSPARMITLTPEKDPNAASSSDDDDDIPVPFRLTGNNVPLTDSLRDYVSTKLRKVLTRYQALVTKVDVHLTVEHNPSISNGHKAEVVVFSGRNILRNEVPAADMYAAIDLVQERISRTLRKYKERRDASKTKSVVPAAEAQDDDEDEAEEIFEEQYNELDKNEIAPGVPDVDEIVRRKVFPMPLQTVKEAVLCCEYVDHPWYLFRNADSPTNEICLVYKRNHGGYGLIEPSNSDGKDDEPVV